MTAPISDDAPVSDAQMRELLFNHKHNWVDAAIVWIPAALERLATNGQERDRTWCRAITVLSIEQMNEVLRALGELRTDNPQSGAQREAK